MPIFILRLAAVTLLLTPLAACDEQGSRSSAAAPPPAAVSFVEVSPADMPIVNELPGRITPHRVAEVRPRVSGIVMERIFAQGGRVKAGDVLYRIDPAPFQVQVANARAGLQRAEAVQMAARQTDERQRELLRRNITSTAEQQNAAASLAQAEADVAAARANLAAAELNLQYSEVRAPIEGTIGRARITEGALVSSNDVLARIQQLDTVYVDFTQSSNDLLALRKAALAQNAANQAAADARVRIKLNNETDYGEQGRFLFSEAAVDETTGQITLRAEMPNPDGELLPGMYVRVVVEQGIDRAILSVPQQAVRRDAGGTAQLYVLTADNKAELRRVRLGRTAGSLVTVEEGVRAGERVVVEGFQKIRPNAVLAPEAWRGPTGETSVSGTSASAG